jgi:hypothetical protein
VACDRSEVAVTQRQAFEAAPETSATEAGTGLVLGSLTLEGDSLRFEFASIDGPATAKAAWQDVDVSFDEATETWRGVLDVSTWNRTLREGTPNLVEGARRMVPIEISGAGEAREVQVWLLVRGGAIQPLWNDDYLALQAELAKDGPLPPSGDLANLPDGFEVPAGGKYRITGVRFFDGSNPATPSSEGSDTDG